MARVSVLMASYNHAAFIGDAIASILAQTMGDLEIIVVDDGSSDNSNAIVAAIQDPRLKHVPLPENIGACAAFNIALSMRTGEFVAVCNSDDLWVPDKLERQLAIIDARPDLGAVFSDVICINDEGALIEEKRLPTYAYEFRQPNRTRAEWIRTLVEHGNCLCHPSVLIRSEVYEQVGNLDNYLRQLPDHDLWLRVVQAYDIHVMADQLVKFRVHNSNTSRPSFANIQRIYRERLLLTKRFFQNVTPENFHAAFMPRGEKVPRDPIEFLQAKVSYLSQANGIMRSEMLEMAIEASYFGALEYGREIIPAYSFQTLSAQTVPQLAKSMMKYRLRSSLERVAGSQISDAVISAVVRMKKRRQEKARP